MSLKSLIAAIIHQVGNTSGFSVARARSIRAGRIIMLHGVGDAVYSIEEFESHLRFLAKNFSIVSLEALGERICKGQRLTNELVLTFDDGLQNNFTAAYPVLQRLNLPATFFVCPGLIERNRWLWNHEARARLQSMTAEQREAVIGEVRGVCGSKVEQIINWMKTIPLTRRDAVESSIRKRNPSFEPTPAQQRKYNMMSWAELRSLDPQLITIGSHTVNHPILSTLEPEQLQSEVSESRRLLEETLGRKVDQFCYPNGSHNPAVVEEVRKHYNLAVTTEPGFVRRTTDPLQLPRIGIVPQPLLSWRMHRPSA